MPDLFSRPDAGGGIAALARQPGAAEPVRNWQPGWALKALWGMFAGRPWALLGGFSASLLRAGVLLGVSGAVGQVVHGGDVWGWTAMAALGLFVSAALGHAGQLAVIAAVHDGLTALRERLVERQLSLPVDVVLQHGSDRFVLAMTRDGELLGQMARACFGALLPGSVLALLCLGGVVVLLPRLILPLGVALLLLWLVRRRLARRLTAQMAPAHAAIDALYEQLGNTVLRHEIAVSQADELHERRACRAAITHAHAQARGLAGTQALVSEVDGLVLGLGLLFLLTWMVAAGPTPHAGSGMASALFLLLALRGVLHGLLNALQEMALGMPALAAIERLLVMPLAPAHRGSVPPTRWRVTMEGVSRRVAGVTLVRDAGVTLEPGRVVVLTGANGAGKTTLLRLLLGLCEADDGTVRVDGVPWSCIDRDEFRRGIGYLPQASVLFAGSVYDNIAYAVPHATRQEVLDAARAAGLGDRLGSWPGGLAMSLGPGGSPLSGGERQRIALARVLLRRPRMLVLDEPTNHLDIAGSQALMDLLRRMPGKPVVFVVSHDPVVIGHADEVLEMVEGRVFVADRS